MVAGSGGGSAPSSISARKPLAKSSEVWLAIVANSPGVLTLSPCARARACDLAHEIVEAAPAIALPAGQRDLRLRHGLEYQPDLLHQGHAVWQAGWWLREQGAKQQGRDEHVTSAYDRSSGLVAFGRWGSVAGPARSAGAPVYAGVTRVLGGHEDEERYRRAIGDVTGW